MIPLWVAFVVLSLFLFKLLGANDDAKGLPGPPAIPFFGNIFQIMKIFLTQKYPFTYLANKYGEVYRLKVPFREIVVLASYDAVTGVFSKAESAGRDTSATVIYRSFGQNAGILFGNGATWDNSKKWMIRNLRSFGFSKSHLLQEFVNIEIKEFFTSLNTNKEDGKIVFPVSQTFLVPVSQIMCKIIAGQDAQISKETLIELNRQVAIAEKASGIGSVGSTLALCIPWIRFIFPEWTGRNCVLSLRQSFQKVSRKLLEAATIKMGQPGAEPNSLTEAFVVQKAKDNNNSNDNSILFADLNYDILFQDLFQASTNSTSSFLETLLLHMILHPDVQDKVYNEIRDIVPAGHEVTYEDKTRMIYTQAVMLECHRVAKIVQNFLPHKAIADFEYKDFKIKKNSMIAACLNSVFYDPLMFKDPKAFKPERFIDSNGNIVNQKLIIAFGTGKRSCLGELFADVSSFLFFTNIVKRYKLCTVPGEPKPTKKMHTGVTSSPYPFSILMTRRGDK